MDKGEYKGYKRESEVNHDIDAGGGKGEEGKDTGCVICAPLQKAFQSSATLFFSLHFLPQQFSSVEQRAAVYALSEGF